MLDQNETHSLVSRGQYTMLRGTCSRGWNFLWACFLWLAAVFKVENMCCGNLFLLLFWFNFLLSWTAVSYVKMWEHCSHMEMWELCSHLFLLNLVTLCLLLLRWSLLLVHDYRFNMLTVLLFVFIIYRYMLELLLLGLRAMCAFYQLHV